ncbi:MAG: helicase-associated domain-containing protein, partial [Chloroflexota bacterium]
MPQSNEPVISELAAFADLYSLATLKRVTRTLNLSIATSSREGFVQGLARFLGTDAHRVLLEKRLAPRDWQVLDVLPFRIGPIRIRDFVAALRDREFSSRDALAELERLLSLGCFLLSDELAYAQRQGIDQSALRIAFHQGWILLTPGIPGWAKDHRAASLGLAPVAPPGTPSEASYSDLHRAVFILLSETARKPMRLTAKGSPYKTEIARLADALAHESPAPGRGAKRSKGSTPVPPIFWFALAALIASEVLARNGQEIAPSADAREFLASPTDHQVRRLLTGWLNGRYDDVSRIPTLATYGEPLEGDPRPDPWRGDDEDDPFVSLGSIGRARAVVVEALNVGVAADRGAWYAIDDLATLAYRQDREMLFPRYPDVELLNEHGYRNAGSDHREPEIYDGVRRANASRDADAVLYRDRDWLEVEGAFTRQALVEALAWLGLVDVGPTSDSADRFRLTELGQRVFSGSLAPPSAADDGPPAVVQPNFDVVVVDALANTALLSQLDEFAERRSIDRAATYRLTQADLLRGLDRGWTAARVFDLLESTSRAPVPQNVAYTLREWIAAYERLTVREQASLLEADNPSQLETWLKDPTISPLLARRLGPTSVLVAPKDADRLIAALASGGGPI